MPVDYELFYTGSPPLFRHSFNAITDFRFCNNVCNRLKSKMTMPIPLRPILIVRSMTTTVETEEQPNDHLSPTSRSKKRVVFADDKGLALAHVKVMTEPSDCPPMWQDEFLEQVTGGASATVVPDKWEPMFQQPASDYVQFRQKLESNCVSLENVIVKDGEQTVLATVKVKNIAFDKEVFARVTYNAWATKEDITAVYVPTGIEGTSVYDLYDTFSFTMKLPLQATRSQCIEFCICFQSNGKEFWDSNSGANYKLVSTPSSPMSPPPKPDVNGSSFSLNNAIDHAQKMNLQYWSEFASWQHLVNDTPYW